MPSSEPPYTPGYGLQPPLLVGRDQLLGRVWAALGKGAGHPDLHQAWVGERGVGKTVAAQWVTDRAARELNWAVIRHQAVAGEEALQALVRRLPEALSPWRRLGREFRKLEKEVTLSVSLGVVSLSTTVRTNTGTTPVETVFESLVRRVGDFARNHDTGLLLVVDEALSLERQPALAALSRSLQTANVEHLPIAAILTGLPSLRERFSGAGTYIRRIQKCELGDLSPDAARLALVEPATHRGVVFSPQALDLLVEQSRGLPYYVQLFGYHAWLAAGSADKIDLGHARAGLEEAYAQLDWEFGPAWERLSPLERNYVTALAGIGPYEAPAEEVARVLGRTTRQLSTARDRLINVHEVLEAPSFGVVGFRYKQFADWALHRRLPAPPLGSAPAKLPRPTTSRQPARSDGRSRADNAAPTERRNSRQPPKGPGQG